MPVPGIKGRPKRERRSQLFLSIDETLYRVVPLATDPESALRAFRLHKRDGTLYDIEETLYGASCDCPDFTFRREGLDPDGCKHVKALVAEGLLDV
ncbi:MAG: hypothetical protein NVSMB9_29420 [Isosphaeraceae bacterium]